MFCLSMAPLDNEDDSDGVHFERDHDGELPTTIATRVRPGDRLTVTAVKNHAEEQWRRAAAVLYENPSLMTSKILMLALSNRAPLHVVRFMLSVNPKAASVPNEGFSALQVALRHHASVDVIEAVIRACPIALYAANKGTNYDPLEYAKIWRKEEPDLISLLSKPISYWLTPSPAATEEQFRQPDSTSSSVALSKVNQQELDNLKFIAASVIKTQKRQTHAIEAHKQQMESFLEDQESRNANERTEQLRLMEQAQQKHFKTQLIALDMKEKAMRAQVRKMENRIKKSMEVAKTERSLREHEQAVTIKRLQASIASMNVRVRKWEKQSQGATQNVRTKARNRVLADNYSPYDTPRKTLETRRGKKKGDSAMPIVYATPYLAEDSTRMEREEGEPLVKRTPSPEKKQLRRVWLSPGKKYFVSM